MSNAPHLGLSEEHLDLVRQILARHVPGRPVYAFGSRAVGRGRRRSDLDLAVGGNTALTLRQRALLNEDFSESDLPIEVDVVDLHTVSPEFLQRIERDFVIVREASELTEVAA